MDTQDNRELCNGSPVLQKITEKLIDIAEQISIELGIEFEFIDIVGGIGTLTVQKRTIWILRKQQKKYQKCSNRKRKNTKQLFLR